MATKLQKIPCKIWLNRKVKFLNNSVIFDNIELEFGMETNFGPLNSKSNIKLYNWRHRDVSRLLGLFADENTNRRHCDVKRQNFTNFMMDVIR